MRIYDNMSRRKKEFVPVNSDYVGMYICGMTVQDKPHIGHMYASIAGDTMRRYLEFRGYGVRYVYNFTDVDDKIIQRANDEGISWKDVAQRNIDAYFKYAQLLGIKAASVYPRASEHIQEIIELVGRIMSKGYAYESGGDVYFAVEKWPSYGSFSGRKLDELRAGARVEPGEKKKNPLDFALWKAAKEGEPYWESPWGNGRPGWHIECSAMSMKYLGESFDIHGGGQDLIFPHHENEMAQSEAATGKRFANFWVENGLVNLTGEKMSKSTKHFFSVEDICAEVDPETLKFYLLSSHYRSPVEFSRERMDKAEAALGRLKNAMRNAAVATGNLDPGEPVPPGEELSLATAEAEKRFVEAMDDDFNSAKALGHLFDLARTINKQIEAGIPAGTGAAVRAAAAKLRELGAVLGIFWKDEHGDEELPDEVTALVGQRESARRNKEWDRADELRLKIEKMGFLVEDRPKGPVVRKKTG
ncbi:MAG: cysteine--tRNA ligase [Candidatus Eiseniibacteriota bacterium]|nr:MAG: cysteine--tRNA ligase [Candidatus Eisenbacteria bacterium]